MIRFASTTFTVLVLVSTLGAGNSFAATNSGASKGAAAKDVLAACDRIADSGGHCNYGVDKNGNIAGCSDHACFICFNSDKRCFG